VSITPFLRDQAFDPEALKNMTMPLQKPAKALV